MQSRNVLLRLLALTLVSLAAVAAQCASVAAASTSTCERLLDKETTERIRAEFPESHIVTVGDLREDDKRLWTRRKGNACPGVAVGHFEPGPANQRAVLLRSKGKKLTLILLTPGKPTRRLFEGEFDVVPVIYRRPPGSLRNAETREVEVWTRNDILVVEVPEAGSSAYYFENEDLKTMALSL